MKKLAEAPNSRDSFGDRDFLDLPTVEEVAELLKVPKSWVYERTRRRGLDRLPHIKLGKYLRFEEPVIKQYLEEQRISR